MLKITVTTDTNPTVRETKAGPMLKQKVWVHLPDSAFPKETNVVRFTDRDTGVMPTPYPAGEYTFDASSFAVKGAYNDLVIDLKLIPLAKKPANPPKD